MVGQLNGHPDRRAAADEDGRRRCHLRDRGRVGLSLFATGKFEGNPEETNRNIKLPNAFLFIMTGKPDWRSRANNLNEQAVVGDPASLKVPRPEFHRRWTTRRSSGWPTGPWRVMLGCGFLLALVRRDRLVVQTAGASCLTRASFPEVGDAGRVAAVHRRHAGWIFTEMGRQPVVFDR